MSVGLADGVRVVLLRPRRAENVGSVARALKNFGLTDCQLVAPGFTDVEQARRTAVQSHDVLDGMSRPPTLDAALTDCVWVVGTSARPVRGKRRLSPRALASEAVERAGRGGKVALVFGEESSGLANDEVDRCHDLSCIPTSDEQPSLNLAQAVLLYAYELRLAWLDSRPRTGAPLPTLAADGLVQQLEGRLRALLTLGGFLQSQERHAVRDLMMPLRRAPLSRSEATLWLAALSSVTRRLKG